MSQTNPLGQFLRGYRQANDMTAQDVAQKCQVPVSVVLDVEHGIKPDQDMMRTLSEGLGIPLIDLHRVAQGEPLEIPALIAAPLPAESVLQESDSPTLFSALQGLSPAQIEKVLDYVQLLKQAEVGRRYSKTP